MSGPTPFLAVKPHTITIEGNFDTSTGENSSGISAQIRSFSFIVSGCKPVVY